MKHARIEWGGQVHDAVEAEGQLEITSGDHQGRRLSLDEVVWLKAVGVICETLNRDCGWGFPVIGSQGF